MFTITIKKRPTLPARIDARVIASRVGKAVANECARAIRTGYYARTGAARKKNASGQPEGYRTGKLARGIHATAPVGNENTAIVRVVPPPDRADWVARRGDVLIVDGRVADLIEKTANEIVAELIK